MTVVFGPEWGPSASGMAAEVLGVLPEFRRQAESLMLDRVVVRRRTGSTTDADFNIVPTFEDVYSPLLAPHGGRAKVQTYEGFEQRSESAGASVTVQRSQVHFPVGAFRGQVGDVVTVLASVDPLLVGRSYRVVQEAPVKTLATAYRVFVDENLDEEVPPWPA